MKKIFAVLLLSVFLLVPNTRPVQAKTNVWETISKETVNPDMSSQYLVKRLKEKVTLIFKFGVDSRIEYLSQLMDKRLSELAYIGENKDTANIEKTSSRYESTAGQLTDFVIEKGRGTFELKSLFERHVPILENTREVYSFESSEYRFIQNDINTLKILSDKLPK